MSGTILIENSNINFKNISFENLQAPYLRLRKLYGGINIVNSKINGDNLKISKSLSEDAINFINSKVKIKKIKLSEIKSDGLDSDFSKFNIGEINCNDIGNDCVTFLIQMDQ